MTDQSNLTRRSRQRRDWAWCNVWMRQGSSLRTGFWAVPRWATGRWLSSGWPGRRRGLSWVGDRLSACQLRLPDLARLAADIARGSLWGGAAVFGSAPGRVGSLGARHGGIAGLSHTICNLAGLVATEYPD